MQTIKVTIKDIAVFTLSDKIYARLKFDKSFTANVRVGEQNVQQEVDYIDYSREHLMHLVCGIVPEINILANHRKELAVGDSAKRFTIANLGIYLIGATLTIDRTPFAKDSTYVDYNGETKVHTHDGFSKEIVAIELTERGERRLDNALANI